MPANPISLDTDAWRLKSGLASGLVPQDQIELANQTLNEYNARVKSEGREPFSALIQHQMEEQKRLRGYFRDVPQLSEEQKLRLDPIVKHSPDRDGALQEIFTTAFLANYYGADSGAVSSQFPAVLRRFATDEMGKDDASVSEAFQFIKGAYELHDAGSRAVTEGAFAGESTGQTWEKFRAANKGATGWSEKNERDYAKRVYLNSYELNRRLAPYRGFISQTVSDLQKNMGVKEGDPEVARSATIDRLLEMPEEDRGLVIKAIVVSGQHPGGKDGGKEGFVGGVQRTGENAYRGTVSLASWIPNLTTRGELLRLQSQISGLRTPVDSKNPAYDAIWGQVGAPAREASEFYFHQQEDTRPLTAEEKKEAQSIIDRALAEAALARQIKDIEDRVIDPASSDSEIFSGWFGAVRSTPQFLAALTPMGPLLITGQFAEDNYHQYIQEGVPREMAHSLAILTAPGQAFVETFSDRFMAGRLKNLVTLWKTPAVTWAEQAKRLWVLPAKGAVEYGEEKLQHFAPYYMQQVAGALSKDVPEVPWETALSGWREQQAEVISTVIWMTALAHGGGSIHEVGSYRHQAQDPLMLEMSGFSPEASKAISEAAKANDWGKAQDLMRAEAKAGRMELDGTKLAAKRDEVIARERAKVEPRIAAERELENLGVIGRMQRVASEQAPNGTYWDLHFRDGSMMRFDSHENANEARWGILEAEGFRVTAAIREALEADSRKLQPGEESSPQFLFESATEEQHLAEHPEDAATLQRRGEQSDVLDDGHERRAYKQAQAQNTATAPDMESEEAVRMVIGRNYTEFVDGIRRRVIELRPGATPLDVVQESVEDDARKLIEQNRGGWLLRNLREFEQKTGEKLFITQNDSEVQASDLIEAYSHVAVSYFAGKSRKGEGKFTNNKGWLDTWRNELRTMGIKRLLDATATKMYAVFRRAAKLMRLSQKGQLAPDFEAQLARSLGLEQAVHEAEVTQEAQGIVDEAHLQLLETLEDGGAAFSISVVERVKHGKRELEEALTRTRAIADRFLQELRPEFAQAVEEDAPNGYPGLDGLAPTKGLSREERIIEARFAQLIADNPEDAVKSYRALAVEDYGSDRYLNGDLARSLLPEYATDAEFRTIYDRATYAPASYLVRRLVMPDILNGDNTGLPYALFLAGGPSSGKSTISKEMLKDTLESSAVIVDSNLATMERGGEFLNAAIDAGLRPQVVFIYTPFQKVEQLVLSRLRKNGRPIPAETLAGNHYDAQQTFIKLADIYEGKADFAVLANEGELADVTEKNLEFLRQRTYASQGDKGSKQYLASRFREHVIREWLGGRLTAVEAIASGWSNVDAEGLGRLQEASQSAQGAARETDASSGRALGGKGFSVSAGPIDARLAAMFDPFTRSPELRQKVGLLAQQRMAKFARQWEAASQRNRTAKDIDAERRARQDQLFMEKVSAAGAVPGMADIKNHPILNEVWGRMLSPAQGRKRGIENEYDDAPPLPRDFYGGSRAPDQLAQELHDGGLLPDAYPATLWKAVEQAYVAVSKNAAAMKKAAAEARTEAKAWADEEKARAAAPSTDRNRLLGALRTLDAILSAFPVEVRGKVGGYVQLAKLSTDEARVEEIERRIRKMDRELEKWLQADITKRLQKLLEKAQPKGEGGERLKGKIGADGHRWFSLVDEAIQMTEDQALDEMAKMEAIIADPAATSEKQDASLERWTVLHQFGGWNDKTASEMATAVESAEQVYKQGRDAWLKTLEERKAERDAIREEATTESGGQAQWTEAQRRAHDEAQSGQRSKFADWMNRHFSFQQVLSTIFGEGKTAAHFERRARAATRQRTDAIIRRIQEFRDGMMSVFGTGTWRDTQRALFNLQERVTDAPVTFYGPASVRRRQAPADIVRLIVDGKAQWSDFDFAADFTQADRDQLVRALEENDKAPTNQKKGMLSFETVATGSALEKGALSQMEAIHFTMLAKQQSYKDAMERHGITQDTLDDMEAWLTPEAKAIRAWLFDQYEQGYAPMNEVYSRMFGVALPRVQNYAPGYFEHEGKRSDMDPFGAGVEPSGMAAGFLKKRKTHLARPQQVDALQAYWQHVQMTEHWLAWAETIQEMRSVFGNVDLRRTVEARRGSGLANDLAWWVETLEMGGVRDSQANAFLAKIMKANVRIGLGYKVSVFLKQFPAMMGSLSDISAGRWTRSARRVITGRAEISPTKMFNEPTIRRRIEAGYSPEMRAGMRGPLAKPSEVEDILEWGMQGISWTDGAFTSFSAAVAYDAHYLQAREMGVSEDEARRLAWEQTENTVGRTAQPVEAMDRSRHELELRGLGKLLFMFQSANRQAFSLALYSLQSAARGGDKGRAARVAFNQFIVIPAMMQTMAGLVRYLFTDDEAEEAWSVEDYAKAMALGPLSGIVFLGAVAQAVVEHLTGSSYGTRPANPAIEAALDVAQTAKDLSEGDFDHKDAGDMASAVGMLLSGVTNAPTESVSVSWSVLKQILGLTESVESISEGDK
jgi:hypothetical protein